jgi:hypothetical protein
MCGKKVVIKKIDQYSPVMAIRSIEPPFAAKEMPVLPCEGIDFAVK